MMAEGGELHVGRRGRPGTGGGSSVGSGATDLREADPGSVVSMVRERFGLGERLARLLSVAASGCPTIDSSNVDGRVRGVFPLPFLSGSRQGIEESRRAGARRKAKSRHRRVSKCNFVIGLLNLMFGGLACLAAALDTRMGSAQMAAATRVYRMSANWDFTPEASEVDAIARQPVVDYALTQDLQAAVDTVPDLVKLPAQVGRASLLDLLPSVWADAYESEDGVVPGAAMAGESAAGQGRTRVYWSPPLRDASVRDVLVKRMWDAGMLRVLSEVRERVGLFTVPRPDGLQRLVVDPRPTNAAWGPPPPIHLTSGPMVARQLQANGKRGVICKCDLSDYYYNLRIPSWMSGWFALPPVSAQLLGLAGDSVDVGFAVLPMGASHAVVLAQLAHLEILERAGLPLDRRLQDGRPLLTPGPFYAVVIDDLVIGCDDDGSVGDDWLELAIAAYREVGLPVAERKVQRDAEAALGMEAPFGRSVAAAPRSKRQRVSHALLAVAEWPAVAPRLLEVLVGHATWAFLFRRAGLAAFGSIFALIHQCADPLVPVFLSGAVRWELITAAALLPLAEICLSAPTSREVLASDASLWGFGVCAAVPPVSLVGEALRCSELRGEYVSLLGQAARRRGQGDRVAERRPLDPGWGEVDWKVKIARPWKGSVQQAAAELQAAELGMEYAARKLDNHGSRQLFLLDARSAIGAIGKGRSSAFSFLRVLRRVAALSFASGIEWCPRWICGEEMPADEASRRFQPRRQRRHDWMNGQRIGESDKPGPGDRPLRGRKLAENTIVRYLRGFFLFYEWAVQTGWATAIRDVDDLERAATQWMEEQHEDGKGAYVGNCLFGAFKLLSPRSFSALLEARALLSDWNAAQAAHWPPLPLPLVFLCVLHQLEKGQKGVAVGFLLAFFCMLRVSELASLTAADIVFRDDKRFWGLQCTLVILQHTKTGDDKTAELRQAWVWPLLRAYVEQCRTAGGDRVGLFPSASTFRSELAISLHRLGVGECGFVMHSFRAGGALYLVNLEVPIDEVLRRGRWRRPESARPYVQRLRALASYSFIPAGLLERGSRLAAAPSLFLSPYF